MDRFRKLIQAVRTKWREFVNRNWNNQPEGDYFRLIDNVLLIGAIRPGQLTKKWQTNCWHLYRLLAPFDYFIFFLNFVENVSGNSFRDTVWHSTVFASASLTFAMHVILNRFWEETQTARDFINGKPSESGDTFYDAAVRKKFFRRTQLLMGVSLLLGFLNQAIMCYPNSGLDELVVTPQRIISLGPAAASGTHFMLTTWAFVMWFCKRFAGTMIMCLQVMGFKMEMHLFTRGFNKILDRVEEDVEENLPTSSTAAEDQPELMEIRRAQRDNLFWTYLNQRVTDKVKKHIELLENLQSLKPGIKWLFGAIYYYTLALVSPIIYTMLLEGTSLFTVVLVTLIGSLFSECYWWCSEIESLQDANDDLEVGIMDLMANIPYTKEHHDDYVGMQKTLMIMKIYVRNSARFSCGGVFDITVEAFRNLLDVSYSVLTFLIDMGNLIQHRRHN